MSVACVFGIERDFVSVSARVQHSARNFPNPPPTQQEEEDPVLLSAAAHAALQRALLDAEGAVQLLGGGQALARLLRQPAAALGGMPADAAAMPPEHATAAAHAFRAALAAAALLAAVSHLAPPDCWAEVRASPGLLASAASAFNWAASLGCCPIPDVVAPTATALQRSAQAALAPLADAIALLAQANAGSPEQLAAASSCVPLPLAAALAAAMSSPTLLQARLAGPLPAACVRVLAVLLQDEAQAHCLLQDSSGREHQVPAAADGPGARQPVGAVLGACLMEHWLEAAAAAGNSSGEGSTDQHPDQRQVLDAALGGLLAFSSSAKQVAVDAGLHSSLLDSCRTLAAGLAGPAANHPLQPQPQPTAAAHRTAKLQQLREARRMGTKQPAAVLAFGSRVPAASGHTIGKRSGRHSSCGEEAGSGATAAEAGQDPAAQADEATAGASQAEPCSGDQPASSLQVHPQQRQQQLVASLLGLLQRLAHNSSSSSDSLVEAGAMDVAAVLWDVGSPAVHATLLSLLASLLHNSAAARAACASTGEQLGRSGKLVVSHMCVCFHLSLPVHWGDPA